MGNEKQIDKIISKFVDSVKESEIIDSFLASLSDDSSVVICSISKFLQPEQSSKINLLQFYKKIKEHYSDSIQTVDDNCFSVSFQVGIFEIKCEIDVYEDNSIMVEMYTLCPVRVSDEDLISSLGKYMLEEFEDVLNILTKSKITN